MLFCFGGKQLPYTIRHHRLPKLHTCLKWSGGNSVLTSKRIREADGA